MLTNDQRETINDLDWSMKQDPGTGSLASRNPAGEPGRQDKFNGCLIIGACFCLTLTVGETFWTFGVFFKPLQQEFGWSRALVSSIFTAFLLGYAISVIVSGRLVDRCNPKPVLLVSAMLIISGLCLCSVGATIKHFRIFLFIVGLGSGATWAVPNATVQRWFYGKKGAGLALGIVTSGVGVGALVFAPLSNFLIQSYGWRTTFLTLGILFGLVVVVATLVLKSVPRDVNVMGKGTEGIGLHAGGQVLAGNRWYASWAFAAILFVVAVGMFTFQIISTHMVPHATDVGISPSAAAAALGLMGGFSILGRVLSGLFSARLGWHRLLSLAYFGMGASMICLCLLRDIWMLHLFAFSYGVFHGVRISAQVGVLPEIFGMNSLGELIGISAAAGQLISTMAPYVAGALFDATDSYSLAFLLIVLLLAAGGVVAGLMKGLAAHTDRL
jgi:MFS transporter, OFA family, oxalate/formate antiporter